MDGMLDPQDPRLSQAWDILKAQNEELTRTSYLPLVSNTDTCLTCAFYNYRGAEYDTFDPHHLCQLLKIELKTTETWQPIKDKDCPKPVKEAT